jgi:hypothetical protein
MRTLIGVQGQLALSVGEAAGFESPPLSEAPPSRTNPFGAGPSPFLEPLQGLTAPLWWPSRVPGRRRL